MFDIVGNIRIQNEKRLAYLLATIKSFEFAKNIGFYLNVDTEYKQIISKTLLNSGFSNYIITFDKDKFGKIYCDLLNVCKNKYVLHFEEDHFCVLDDIKKMQKIIELAIQYKVDLIKVTFFNLEQISHEPIKNVIFENEYCKIFLNSRDNYNLSQHFVRRFYIGTNCFFERQFALKYWGRDVDTYKPHSFEIRTYDKEFEHILMIPKIEILRAIDDDHSTADKCLLKSPTDKWLKLHNV